MDEAELLSRVQALSKDYGGARSALQGPGDDCALLEVAGGGAVAISTDLYHSGVHFPTGLDVESIAGHCLSGAISDLAAVGAKPLAMTLAASAENPEWLNELLPFCFDINAAYKMQLIGGDISQGPASLCVTVFGQTDVRQALTRAGASIGDDIWVSGQLGEAAAGLEILQNLLAANTTKDASQPMERHLIDRFCQPSARVELGMALQGVASAAIDISDGLLTDLDKLLSASGCGGLIELKSLPISVQLDGYAQAQNRTAVDYAGTGGDDYELCFTVPETRRRQIDSLASRLGLELSRIGGAVAEPGLRGADNTPLPDISGWRHFAAANQ